MKIKLRDIENTWGYLTDLKKTIDSELHDKIILARDNVQLAFFTLKIFDFRNGVFSLSDINSIQKACIKILEKFKLYENGKARELGILKNDLTLTPIDQYVKHILGFNKLPQTVFLSLEVKVKKDLVELLSLISRYEQDNVVQGYIKGERRGEHEAKTKIDFYNRCVRERDGIVKYLANDLVFRAISKARIDEIWAAHLLTRWTERELDRPYRWGQYRSIEYFDYKRINICRHRLEDLYIEEIADLEKLYPKKISLFYKKLKKKITPGVIFHEINTFYVPSLPKLKERIAIFKELEKLFRGQKWYGFTALALTQVEGIFSDILHIATPKTHLNSLSTKVSAIRTFYTGEERSFDYFEYHLPRLRNRFLHSGSVVGENFKLIALDLLHDLRFVMRAFYRLNDPVIELNNLLNKDPVMAITGVASLVHFFDLVEEIKNKLNGNQGHKEMEDVLKRWDNYQSALDASSDIRYYAENINADIDQRLTNFLSGIQIYEITGSLNTLDKVDLKFINKNQDRLAEIIDRIGFNLAEDFLYLNDVRILASSFKKYLPNCSDESKAILSSIFKRNRNNFVKILLLVPAFKKHKELFN